MEKRSCEACSKKHDVNTSVPTADDCYLCPDCHADWEQNVFNKCSHAWEPYSDDRVICKGCSGAVLHEFAKAA